MLNRSNCFVLFLALFVVSSVVAEPPIAADSYQAVLRVRSTIAKNEVRPAAVQVKGRLVATSAPAAKVGSGSDTTSNAAATSNSKPAPIVLPANGPMTGSLCQTCVPCQRCGCGRCGHHGYLFGADPFGFCVCGALNAQISNGLAAQLVLYRYDFNNAPATAGGDSIDPADLNPRGRRQLLKVAELLNGLAMPPVIIEASDNRQFDEARRQKVITSLAELMGSPVPEEWVVIGEPIANALNGEEAAIIHDNLLRQTEERGLYDANDRSSEQNNGQGFNSFPTTPNINQ
jgi:hypothetical protein